MKILVTGSHGFIGSHLVKELESKGYDVNCYDRVINKDARNISIKEIDETDFVVHLAADANVRESMNDPDRYYKNNILLTKRLQGLCDTLETPMVYASSSCVYNWHLTPYGASKMTNEMTARPHQVGLRFTTVFGEGCRETMFYYKIKNDKLNTVTNHVRDFLHVSDAVSAIMIFIETGTHDKLPTYDVGTGNGVRIDWIANHIMGRNLPVNNGASFESINNTCNPSQMERLGWKAQYEITDFL